MLFAINDAQSIYTKIGKYDFNGSIAYPRQKLKTILHDKILNKLLFIMNVYNVLGSYAFF